MTQDGASQIARHRGQTLAAINAELATVQRGRAEQNRLQIQGRRLIEEMAARVAGSTRADVQILVTGIQFCDSYAQRLGHVCLLVPMAETGGASAISGLIAAQIRALAKDADEKVADLGCALQAISEPGRETGATFVGKSGAAAPDAGLDMRRQALEKAIQSRRIVEPAILCTNPSAALVGGGIASTVSRFAELIKTAEVMTLSAYGAGLLALRGGTARNALSVLALAVHESVGACRREVKGCRAAQAVVGAGRSNGNSGAIEAAAPDFARRLDACAAKISVTDAILRQIEMIRRASLGVAAKLRRAIVASTAEVVFVLNTFHQLRDTARDLVPDPANIQGADSGAVDLDDKFELCTMKRKREVHRTVFGLPEGLEYRNAGAVAASLDDILF